MNVEIETLDTVRVVAVRHIGPYPQMAEAFARLHALAGPAGLFSPGSEMVALYYDDPETTPAAELRSDAGFTVTVESALPEGLHQVSIPAGRYARGLHVGRYAELGEALAQLLGQWLPSSGERLARSALTFDRYLNDPSETPEEKLLTHLYIALD